MIQGDSIEYDLLAKWADFDCKGDYSCEIGVLNMIDGITELAISGRGNNGRTMYDVLNGATEYWTSGDGVGRTASAGKKAYSSEFGNAAASKERFSEYLVGGEFESGLQEDTKRILALTA